MNTWEKVRKNTGRGYSTDLCLREKDFREMYMRQYICP